MPKAHCFFGCANLVLEYCETSNGVREVQRPPILTLAIDRESFHIAGFGQVESFRVVIGIAKVSNGVRQSQRIVDLSRTGNREFVLKDIGI